MTMSESECIAIHSVTGSLTVTPEAAAGGCGRQARAGICLSLGTSEAGLLGRAASGLNLKGHGGPRTRTRKPAQTQKSPVSSQYYCAAAAVVSDFGLGLLSGLRRAGGRA